MVFTIPKAIRGLFERERRLLGLLSRTAYEAILKSFQALFDRKDVRPGCVFSIQTHGSFAANFNPHCHAIISDGVWTREGEFLELPSLDTAAVCELFRRLLLRRLHKEERLSERFMDNLLSWATVVFLFPKGLFLWVRLNFVEVVGIAFDGEVKPPPSGYPCLPGATGFVILLSS